MKTSLQIMHDADIKNHWIAAICHMTDDQVNEARDEYEKELEYYAGQRKNELPCDYRQDFLDISDEEANEYRLNYLRSEYKEAKRNFQQYCKEYAELKRLEPRLSGAWHVKAIQTEELKMHKTLRLARVLQGKKDDIRPEVIAKAREYPISDILKVNKAGMAHCPFHEDKKPSMDTRKNFFHCYSCGESGDVISLMMKMENLTFTQAIKRLT